MAHRRSKRAHHNQNLDSKQAEISIQANWPVVTAGGALALLGLRKISSIQGLALAAVGGALVYQGLGYFCIGADCIAISERPDPLVEQDPVDEASWESFPASDSPSFSPGRA